MWAQSVDAQTRYERDDAQSDQVQQQPVAPVQPVEPGRSSDTAVGRVGERQARGQIIANGKPMSRIENRINSRISSRLRSRIDRNYDSQATGTSSIEAAEDQVLKGNR